ncbi:MAG: bifunctional hydroxymethylpyrimidine kinase/phosphomethylpyrimidine kinase [Methanosarcinales archaeon]|nr:bifunctional hydroxymethylpyrimidine kinase/phosphomethylpyrimidine kinase [ANME-2 cluster archaeon]MDF1531971.1 bifunctional hydroxymethylpyrimidine kinase/phosphomethylpyrimidine kinase [ANME-2 cluster archaeon]MDW7775428.1 bifunctional hydroxymethylpyrimidine kinase/phosphomethylpyrimidine kinase [Methanosarcinales archaeon]
MGEYLVVMTIAGSDSGGGAGIQADLKTFSALGAHGTCALTSITSQNTTGVLDFYDLPPSVIASQIRAVASDMDIAHAKTGMLSSSEIILAVAEMVREYRIPLVVDPVMSAEAGGSLLRSDAVKTLQEELIPLSKVVTPNIHEAGMLAGIKVNDWQDAKEAARRIADAGANAVIITGGHLDGSDLLYDGLDFTLVEGELVRGGTHGAGCTYSAALTVFLATGHSLRDAAAGAKLFVTRAILESRSVGRGVGPVNPGRHTLRTAQMYEALNDVREAVAMLESSAGFAALIPEVGCNVAAAVPHAASVDEVCAVRGRIVRLHDRARAVGCPAFGASSHVARIVLAAMHHDAGLRSALNIRYSEDVLGVIEDIGLAVTSFDRAHEPEGVSTMEWGTRIAIDSYRNLHNRVPDVVFDLGAVGKEPMVRLLAHRAVDAAGRALEIARRLGEE